MQVSSKSPKNTSLSGWHPPAALSEDEGHARCAATGDACWGQVTVTDTGRNTPRCAGTVLKVRESIQDSGLVEPNELSEQKFASNSCSLEFYGFLLPLDSTSPSIPLSSQSLSSTTERCKMSIKQVKTYLSHQGQKDCLDYIFWWSRCMLKELFISVLDPVIFLCEDIYKPDAHSFIASLIEHLKSFYNLFLNFSYRTICKKKHKKRKRKIHWAVATDLFPIWELQQQKHQNW